MKDLAVVGKRLPIKDGWEKVTGQLQFCDDLPFNHMLHGKILRSPYAHARIVSIDPSRAKSLPGVRAVVTGSDTLGIKFGGVKYGPVIQDQEVLNTEKVRFIGDEVAAVAAEDEETAREALDLIRVEYEPLPQVFDPEEAMKPGAPLIFETGNVAKTIRLKRGDVEAAFAQADEVFAERIETPWQFHGWAEPNICVAQFSAGGRLTVWGPNQIPFLTRNMLAQVFNLPLPKVTFVQTPVGGGFGGRTRQRLFEICGLLALKADSRPVRLCYTREEEFLCAQPRIPMVFYLQTAFKKDGTILAKKTKIIADNGAYTFSGPGIMGAAATRIDCLYRIKNVETEAFLVYTNNLPTSAFRGFGNLQMHFAFETHLDTAARKLGLDPAEVRLRNATQAGDLTVHGWKIKSCGLTDCIEKAKKITDWGKKRKIKEEGYGIGMACCIHVAGSRAVFPPFDGSSAVVRIDDAARVQVLIGDPDLGQGSKTILAQIAAEVLGVNYERVEVQDVHTDTSPFGLGTYADRVTNLAGNAVLRAAQDAKTKFLTLVAHKRGLNPEGLEIRNLEGFQAIVSQDDPKFRLPLEEAAREVCYSMAGGHILGEGVYIPEDVEFPDETFYGNITSVHAFAVQVAEIKVDRLTGKIKVLNVTCVSDSGTVINPNLFEGQYEGGVAQGYGLALTEKVIMKKGQVLNARLLDYGLPTSKDVPPVHLTWMEHTASTCSGPFGAKTAGHPAILPTAPAIANAVYQAINLRADKIPLSPERVREYIGLKDL